MVSRALCWSRAFFYTQGWCRLEGVVPQSSVNGDCVTSTKFLASGPVKRACCASMMYLRYDVAPPAFLVLHEGNMNMPSDAPPPTTTPQAEIVHHSSTEEEKDQSSPTLIDHASPPKAVDGALASKETADNSTQTDSTLEQATTQSTQTDPAPEQPPAMPPTLQTPNAARTLQTITAIPTRARIPLSRPLPPEPYKPCRCCIPCIPAILIIICAFVIVMALAFARDPNGHGSISGVTPTRAP